jgi:hypothetical protein
LIYSLGSFDVDVHDDNKITADIYTAKAIQDNPNVCLTQGDYLLIAVMSGGDYSKVNTL